jgi:hypothetical protein
MTWGVSVGEIFFLFSLLQSVVSEMVLAYFTSLRRFSLLQNALCNLDLTLVMPVQAYRRMVTAGPRKAIKRFNILDCNKADASSKCPIYVD